MDRLKYRPMRRPLSDLLRWAFNRKPHWGHDYAEDVKRGETPVAEPEAEAATRPEKDDGRM